VSKRGGQRQGRREKGGGGGKWRGVWGWGGGGRWRNTDGGQRKGDKRAERVSVVTLGVLPLHYRGLKGWGGRRIKELGKAGGELLVQKCEPGYCLEGSGH